MIKYDVSSNRLFMDSLYLNRKVPTLLRVFIRNLSWVLTVIFFFIHWDDHVIFLLSLLLWKCLISKRWNHTYIPGIKPSLGHAILLFACITGFSLIKFYFQIDIYINEGYLSVVFFSHGFGLFGHWSKSGPIKWDGAFNFLSIFCKSL